MVMLPLFPLIGFLLLFAVGKFFPKWLVSVVACGTILVSFALSAFAFWVVKSSGADVMISVFQWIVPFSFLLDPLSTHMLLIITGIGFLIHVYSVGYMWEDDHFSRFFSYMNLVIFFMTLLVMCSDYLTMFIGWEGVGLCSYLLIGFWFKNQEYNNAAKKAFIMNRIGDLGFLLAIFVMIIYFGASSFSAVLSPAHASPFITIITLLLFVGAIGKSAQIPLYTWLPDAMAGPTPVSALIHAATMVTAGVYLVIRSQTLFSLAPITLLIVSVVGIATALWAAFIALRQSDIKKVLAYSTVSQLGYMVLALGMGAYSTALFHLTTHAFFKALLFLAAGSVIHALSGEQDLSKMGGLRKAIPWTFAVFAIGTLAIAGLPPLSGFFSKEEILTVAMQHSPVFFWLLWVVYIMTAVYMFRLLFLCFFGQSRSLAHPHESPWVMQLPMLVLAVLAAGGGVLKEHPVDLKLGVMTLAVTLAAMTGTYLYYRKTIDVKTREDGVDAVYDFLFVRPSQALANAFYAVDRQLDRILVSAAPAAQAVGGVLRFVQSGSINLYMTVMTLAAAVVVIVGMLWTN